jgi:hypothetical protein
MSVPFSRGWAGPIVNHGYDTEADLDGHDTSGERSAGFSVGAGSSAEQPSRRATMDASGPQAQVDEDRDHDGQQAATDS